MIEFDVDMGYLLEYDELDCVVLNDENGEHEPMEFVPKAGIETCENEWAQFGKFRCSECWLQIDSISTNTTTPIPIKYCPNCGKEVVRDDRRQ